MSRVKQRLGLRAMLALGGAALVPFAAPDAPTDTASAPDFERDVRPFLERHCVECHQGADPEGDLDLTPHLDEAHARASFDDWDYLRERVLDGDMPPRSRPRPGGAESETFLAWIDAAHGPVDPRFRPLDPGRPVLRRLNAREYRRTVKMLTGVDFPAEEIFPADAVGFGFDHIGESLSLPDALLEKYLEAAERIADEAVVRWSPADAEPVVFGAPALEGGADRGQFRGLYSRGDVTASTQVRHPGVYRITVEAWGQQAGDEATRMAVSVGRRELQRFDVPETRAEPGRHSLEVELDAGPLQISVTFLNDYYVKDVADRNFFVNAIELQGPAEAPAPTAFQAELMAPLAELRSDKKKREAMLTALMERAWRRPIARGEMLRLAKSLPEEAGLDTQLHQALVTLLVSPQFLFRLEADEAQLPAALDEAIRAEFAGERPLHAATRALDDWELATRLAYFLTSGPPDEALRTLAAAGALTAGDGGRSAAQVLQDEVDRLLQSPHSRSFIHAFAGQWLQLRNLDRLAVDTSRYPQWSVGLRDAMKRETFLLFEAILREDRDVRELLDADFTFLNEELAAHYGMDGIEGSEHRRVSLAGLPKRAGLLGQASVLTLTSNPTRTSPVKRGKWILENLLGAPPPPPPPEADTLDEAAVDSAASLREQLAQHRAMPSCAVCHDAMDPLGLGLERFGPIGEYRAEDQGVAIDASGVLPDGSRFDGVADLRALLRQDPAFVQTVTERLLVYSLGRGLERSDRATVQGILSGLNPERPTLRAILRGIVESPAFRLRRTRT